MTQQLDLAATRRPGPRARHNLSTQPTPLLGRAREIERARRALLEPAGQPAVRLLTLTGPGGTGKTRLAAEIGHTLLGDFEDGVFFVDLAPIQDAKFVSSAIVQTLGIRAGGEQPAFDRLLEYLAPRQVLLILDNFEQVVSAAAQLSQLLTRCPRLQLLVTSRARLRLRWEHVVTVPPLEVPDLLRLPDPDGLAHVPAVMLFVERARAIDPHFSLTEANAEAIAALCVRLDGMPLSLELAAARIDVLTPQHILARLDRPLELLATDGSDVAERHQSMRRTVGWSYNLLSPGEQKLFRWMAIFPAGCALEAASAVCDEDHPADAILDGLSALAGRSLLRRETQSNDELRFGMLETIRAFALEQLEASHELERAGRRFRDYFVALAESAEANLVGPDQAMWLETLEREHANLRAALRWCIDRGHAEEGLRLAGALWRFWFTWRHLPEGSQWLDECLALATQSPVTPQTRARALNGAGNLAHARGDLQRAATLHEEALAVRRRLGDGRGIAVSLNSLANVAVERGDYAAARALHEDSLALRRALGDQRGIAIALNNLGVIARDEADWERAATLSRESAELFKGLGDKQGVALSLVTLGAAEYHLGSYAAATALHQESLALFSELENRREIAECLQVVAMLAREQHQPLRAVRLFGATDAALEQMGSTMRPAHNPRYAVHVAELRDEVGPDAFSTAWAEGREMRLDEAMALAVSAERTSVGPPVRAPARRPGQPRGARELASAHSPRDAIDERLTRREQEVASLLARGLTNRQIANELTITERTAETHVCRILNKLGLRRRAQLTAWAVEHKLVGPS